MKKAITLKKIIDNSNIPPSLIRAVVKQSGGFESFCEMAEDINNNGIGGGFHGWIYYSDTVSFCSRNKKYILEMAEAQADDFGQSTLEMIKSFNCIKSIEITEDELIRVIYTGRDTKDGLKDLVYNCLAWYAGEEVARAYCDILEVDQ